MKKIFTYLMLFFGSLTVLAQTFTQGDFTYSVIPSTNNVSVKVANTSLTVADIPSSVSNAGTTYSVTQIEELGFADCYTLSSVTIPNSITSMGDNVFRNCSLLASINIPDSVTTIGKAAFNNCSSLSSVILSNSINIISDSMFSGCSSLETLTIPSSVNSIENAAFVGCNLTSLTIPNSVISIGDFAFMDNVFLTTISIPNSVINIGFSAFMNCTSLESITIPESVTIIGDNAFAFCNALNSVTVLNPTPLIINPSIFIAVPIENIPLIVPAGSEALYQVANVWKDFMSVGTLSSSKFDLTNKMSVFPNPSSGVFNVKIDKNITLEVFDLSGKQIKTQKATTGVSPIDLSGFKAGVYLLKATNSSSQSKVIKIIKK